jgi:diguanylate cyclase (GGDEF)-like protein/PAS domain S-box-containing protein
VALVIAAAALALAGLATMAGWVFQQPALVRIFPGYLMVFSSAFGFAVAGIALLSGAFARGWRKPVHSGAGLLLASLGALALAQHVFGTGFGIDWPGLHTWMPDPGRNLTPGRMLPATGAGFVLSGAVFLLAPQARGIAVTVTVRALTVALGVLGGLAVAGFLLDLSDVLEVYWLNQLPLPTALCFTLLAFALWLDWRGEPWNARRLIGGEDDRIAMAGALVLAICIVASGLVVFWVMFAQMERNLVADLTFDLKHRRILMASAIERAVSDTAAVGERPNVRRIYAATSAHPADSKSYAFLPAVAANMLNDGFSAFAFIDAQGRELGRAGTFFEQSDLHIRLPQGSGALRVELLWDRGFLLEVRADIADGMRLGEVRAQHRLTELAGITTDVEELGTTGEFAVCGLRAGKLHCAPTRFQPRVFDVPLVVGGRLPMSIAMRGETGVLKLTDYRGQRVLAAYAPFGVSGTALVLKNDLSELYAPIRKGVGFLVASLLLVTLAGGWALRWRVRPLVRGLVRGEERLRAALDGSQLAVWDWDLRTGRVYLSEQWSALLGDVPRAAEVPYADLAGLIHPDDRIAVGEQVQALLKGTISHYATEHRVRTLSGDWRWIRSRGQVVERARDGKALRAIGTNVDIQERKQQELQMAHRAAHDMLTGLPNRSMFHDRLEQALLRSRRAKTLMAVMYLDADKFKAVNDTLGHAAGDTVLKEFARRLTAAVRATDTVARFGGDEFAAILENLGERGNGLRIAGDIVAAMRAAFATDSGAASISASIGIAFHEGTAEIKSADLLKTADRALYEAKGSGRDRYFVADESDRAPPAADANSR